jgi:CotS family spore coat protein
VEYRYRDKACLTNYMLDTKLFDNYDFKVEDAEPTRSEYVLTTDKGPKILKKIDYSLSELMFIHDSLNKIAAKYPFVINFKETTSGKPYAEYEDGIYVVFDMVEGRECSLENPDDLKSAASALSMLHEAGRDIEFKNNKRNMLGEMIKIYYKKINEMIKFREIAEIHVNKSDFDKVYLEYSSYYIDCADKAAKCLQQSDYFLMCKRNRTLNHNDLSRHNIMVGNDNNIYFLDFDYCIIDTPCRDVSNFIIKSIKNNGWNIEAADNIFSSYNTKIEIMQEDFEVLYGYLLFPEDFYEASTGYYMRVRNWDEGEFADNLIKKVEYKNNREKFLSDFKEQWVH